MIAPREGYRTMAIPDLAGRTAVVTGAASGIGRHLALQLAAKGCHVACVDIDADRLAALEAELRGVRVTVHVADVSDRARMLALGPEVAAAHGALHLLVNNAGIAYEAAFPQTSLETWDKVLGVNLWGVIYGCHVFLPYLAKADRAHVVNLSSLFGIIGMPGQTAYCASKFAVRGLSEALWEELAGTTVGLTVVHPGSVATPIMERAEGDDPELMAHLATWYRDNAYPPEKAARKIIRAVEKGRRRLLVAPEAAFADYLKRALPVWGNRLFSDVAIRVLKVGYMRERRRAQWQRTMVDGR